MERKVSIYDIAKHLNLSVATVSYVINNKGKISQETKDRVNQAIKDLGYVMNSTARTLSTGKSHLIGLLLPLSSSNSGFIQNPFYGEFIAGLRMEISNYDYDIVISNLKSIDKLVDWISSRGLDGLIMLGKYPREIYEKIKEIDIPVVLTDVYEDYSKEFLNVRVDDEYGVYLATKYLLDNGHTKIGFVGNRLQSLVDHQRYLGYKKAIAEAKIENEYTFDCFSTFDDGYMIADDIINSDVTGVVCASDILAIGIISKYHNKGIEVPKNLSLVGFDDIQNSKYVYPALTTIRQDIEQKAVVAAKLVLDSLEKSENNVTLQVLEPKLVIRDSVNKIG